ncbi:MAG: (2Fe-2S) ferredoxin domain-containing protein [Oscillospiraceae bacterium]|jgi:NADP-reducing hydrogenase subunit HndB|nr:(2Fe-2S) ferredoxin domain-containing protein [Oscillospiraceae bacterium]
MKTLAELQAIRDKARKEINLREENPDAIRVMVGMATCGIAAGARPVLNALVEETGKRNLTNVTVTQTGCIGLCQNEPVVEVLVPGQDKVTYINVDAEKAIRIVNDHIVNGNVVSEYTIGTAIK